MTTICTSCGNPVSASFNLNGICPRCVLEASRDPDPVPPDAPPLAQLAAMFPELEIQECLGRGGMGAVYRVRQIQLDRPAALKIMLTPPIDEARFRERFLNEARSLARLDHPGVVKLYGFGETAGQHWMLMEYVDGANLRTLMRERAITTTLALSIVRQVCEAVQSAHQCKIVHRDIKPENVLLDRYGHVKLVDFGLAKLRDGLADLTRSLVGLGTAHYAAPEQTLQAKEADARADVYSLGVLCYELLTGELPLGRFDPPAQRAGLGKEFDDVILRAMERNPDRRQRDAGELRRDFDRAASALQTVAEKLGDLASPTPAPEGAAAAAAQPESAVAVAAGDTGPRRWTTPAWYGMVVCALWVVVSTFLRWWPDADLGRPGLWDGAALESDYDFMDVNAQSWVAPFLICIAGACVAGFGRTGARRVLSLFLWAPVVVLGLSIGGYLLNEDLLDIAGVILAFMLLEHSNPAAPILMTVALVGLVRLAKLDRKAHLDPALRARLAHSITSRRLVVAGTLPVAAAVALEFTSLELGDLAWRGARATVPADGTADSTAETRSEADGRAQLRLKLHPTWVDRPDFGEALAVVGKALYLEDDTTTAETRAEADAHAQLGLKMHARLVALVSTWAKETGDVLDERMIDASLSDATWIRRLTDAKLNGARETHTALECNVYYVLMILDNPGWWVSQIGRRLEEQVGRYDAVSRSEAVKRAFLDKLTYVVARDAAAAAKSTAALLDSLERELLDDLRRQAESDSAVTPVKRK